MRYIAIVLCAVIFGAARADDRPILQLDTGGHMATIRGVAFTPDGKQLVSAGDDKDSVWDLVNGKTIRTIRGESSIGNLGKIFAMALSSDGKWLAVAGDLRALNDREPQSNDNIQTIRIYDFKSGKLVALMKGHTAAVRALSFSANGGKLHIGQ